MNWERPSTSARAPGVRRLIALARYHSLCEFSPRVPPSAGTSGTPPSPFDRRVDQTEGDAEADPKGLLRRPSDRHSHHGGGKVDTPCDHRGNDPSQASWPRISPRKLHGESSQRSGGCQVPADLLSAALAEGRSWNATYLGCAPSSSTPIGNRPRPSELPQPRQAVRVGVTAPHPPPAVFMGGPADRPRRGLIALVDLEVPVVGGGFRRQPNG